MKTFLEIYQLKDRISFSLKVDFRHFGVISFYRGQMQHVFICVNISCGVDEIIGFIYSKHKKTPNSFFIGEYLLN